GVLYDPDDHDKIMLDETAPMMPGSFTLAGGDATTMSVGGGPSRDPMELMKQVQEAQAQAGGDPQALAALLREKLGAKQVFVDGATTFGAPAVDPLDRLEQAQRLHAAGVLNDEEFAEQKARILGET